MTQEAGGKRVLAKYVAFQIPGAALVALALGSAVNWWDLPLRYAVGLLALWVLKDAVLYPFVRIAYEPGSGAVSDRLADATGIAKQALDPVGYVQVGSELWRARLAAGTPAVASGAVVRVRAVNGLTLVVEAHEPGAGDSEASG